MKQLIPQSKINEASSNATENRFDLKGLIAYGDIYEQGFRAGVQFTLNEIQPLIVECLNYSFKNYHSFDGIIVPINTNDVFRKITTQQLLEEFFNSKNTKK